MQFYANFSYSYISIRQALKLFQLWFWNDVMSILQVVEKFYVKFKVILFNGIIIYATLY